VTDGQKVDHGKLYYTQTPLTRDGKTLDGLREFLAGKYAPRKRDSIEGPARSKLLTIGDSRCALTSRSKAALESEMSERTLVIPNHS